LISAVPAAANWRMLGPADMDAPAKTILSSAARVAFALALAAAGVGGCSATPLQVSDSGAAGAAGGSDGGSPISSCPVVVASDYDQSCVVDEDCVSVGQQPKCPVTDCSGCIPGAINKSAMARYMSALSHAVAAVMSDVPGVLCHCPCEGGFAICRGGKCEAAACGPPNADTLPACTQARGICAYVANSLCTTKGPPGACAYDDEICCLD